MYAALRSLCSSRRAAPDLAYEGMRAPLERQDGVAGGADAQDEAPSALTSASAIARCAALRDRLETADLLAGGAGRCVALAYDDRTQLHLGPPGHPEQPTRVQEILRQLAMSGLLRACARVPSREATEDELLSCHARDYVEKALNPDFSGKKKKAVDADAAAAPQAPSRRKKSSDAEGKEKDKDKDKKYVFPFGPDTYVCEHSPLAAKLAAGSSLSIIDAAFDPNSPIKCGFTVVRPPGHHASVKSTSGFCLFNNPGIAAKHMQKHHGIKRIMIVDWDVHHGNGTNDIFTEDTDVVFFSMHRYDSQGFFPGTGILEDVGHGAARGYNVNVPLDKGYGDLDVVHVMKHVLCPLVDKFQPEAIIVSAGFDAVKGDPLGDCRVSPQGFGWMTRCLFRLARHYCNSRLFLMLEGGYNPDLIAQCTVECIGALVAETAGLDPQIPQDSDPVGASDAAADAFCAPPTPLTGSPATSPGQSPANSPASTPPSSVPSSPALRSKEGDSPSNSKKSRDRPLPRGPSAKTVRAVRQLTEFLSIMPLQLPLAPKPGNSAGAKSSRKNEKRRNKKGDGAASEDGTASDSSGWAIATAGQSDSEACIGTPAFNASTPPASPAQKKRGGAVEPQAAFSFELPPAASEE